MTDLFDPSSSPTVEPDALVRGVFTQWRIAFSTSDAAHSVYYKIGTPGQETPVTVSGTYDDNGHWLFTIGSDDYAGILAGENRWDLYVERDSDSQRIILSTGLITVHETSADRRTYAEVMVSKIESILQGRADHDVESYSIKSRSITRMNVMELTKWRDYFRAEVDRTGGSSSSKQRADNKTVRVRFI